MRTSPKRRTAARQKSGENKAAKRVLVVDDHPMTRSGLVQLIETQPGLVVCGEAANRQEALRLLARSEPDLMIVDLSMPGGGLELIKDVRVLRPKLVVMVVSMLDEKIYAHRTLRAGASGYVMKEAGAETVLTALKTVLEGRTYVSPEMEERFVKAMAQTQPQAQPVYGQLTTRELQILEQIGQGKSTKEIAADFNLSIRTIDCHRANVRKKLGLKGSSELLKYAVFWWESQQAR